LRNGLESSRSPNPSYVYTTAEEADFYHVAGLHQPGPSSIVYAICRGDELCELNGLPGGPSYSLTKLENEFQDMLHLEGFHYFIKKFCEPMLQGVQWFPAGFYYFLSMDFLATVHVKMNPGGLL